MDETSAILAIPSGSWAEWVTGALTAAAVAITGVAVLFEIRSRKAADERHQQELLELHRAAARRLSVMPNGGGGQLGVADGWEAKFDMENAGADAFFDLDIQLRWPASGHVDSQHRQILRAGHRHSISFWGTWRKQDPKPAVTIDFTDIGGRRWHLDESGRVRGPNPTPTPQVVENERELMRDDE